MDIYSTIEIPTAEIKFCYILIIWHLLLAGQVKRIKAEESFESKLMTKKADAVWLRIQRALIGEGEPPSHSIIN